ERLPALRSSGAPSDIAAEKVPEADRDQSGLLRVSAAWRRLRGDDRPRARRPVEVTYGIRSVVAFHGGRRPPAGVGSRAKIRPVRRGPVDGDSPRRLWPRLPSRRCAVGGGPGIVSRASAREHLVAVGAVG